MIQTRVRPFGNYLDLVVTLFLVSTVSWSHAGGGPTNIQITDDNWDQILEGEWMVEFYAPWCPACRNLQAIWDDFSTWSSDLGIQIGQVDITNSPGLSGRFMITALPTIYHIKDGIFRQYRSSRTRDDFLKFVEEKKWTEVDPISSWQSPASFQMTIISQFYRLSMSLRNFMNTMTSEYGLPPWGTYLIFGGATICLGLILGLLLVCVIDFVYPPKKLKPIDTSSLKTPTPDVQEEDEADDDDDDLQEDDGVSEEDEQEISEGDKEEEQSAPGTPVTGSKDNVRRRPKKID